MGKHGPCRHCGVTSTPLWRNGPPEKPVLCNACGSRWRTKGSLTNYTPLHAREPIDSEEPKVSKVKSISIKPKEQKSHKKKLSNSTLKNERGIPYCDQNFRKVVEGDMSNRSSSGSAVSYSESCAHVGTTDASDLTGSAQSNVWDSLVPSKKRTCVTRPKHSSVEKLTKDLHSILHEQQSSYLSGSSEEDLLYESGTPMDSFEIGYGSLLIRNPNSKSVEEESEASSLPVDNKSHIINEAYSGSASFHVHSESKETSFSNSGIEKLKKSSAEVIQEEKNPNENFQILRDRNSPLSSVDLKDVINFEGFMKYLTHGEQQLLMKYLPSTDTAKSPESIKSMFDSPQFVEILANFQQLLLEGIFDLSFSEANAEDCRTLKRLVLFNLTKCRWVEYYEQLKDGGSKQSKGQNRLVTGPNFHGNANPAYLKRPRVGHIQNLSELKGGMKSPKIVCKSGATNPPSKGSPYRDSSDARSKLTDETDDFIDNEGACFSPRSFFASPPDRRSLLVPLQFTDDSSDHDLLLDVPCNASFPEAELLYHPWRQKTVANAPPADSKVAEGEESRSDYPSCSISNKQAKHR